jgi:NitT/TauT family transport system ATP-binding protein
MAEQATASTGDQYPDIIRFEDVGRLYRDRVTNKTNIAIENINFVISDLPGKGEFHVFLGPSGCGKSTILKLIAGLDFPTSGKVLLNGSPITGPGRDRGMVFQAYSSFPHMSVLENVEFGLKLMGASKKLRNERALQFIEQVGLKDHITKFPKELSGGMRQRVALARTLAVGAKIVLFDEPFGALDPSTREEMQELVDTIWNQIEGTFIMVTHDIPEAVFLADTIHIMKASPGTIIKNIAVDLPDHRTRDMKSSVQFKDLVNAVTEVLTHKEISGRFTMSM